MKYKIIGSTVPAVEICFDDKNEEIITQSGGMAWMSDGVSMSTDTNGGVLAGIGRLFTGESMFFNRYRANKAGSYIAFATTLPGTIVPININDYPKGMICQKGAFLCSQSTVKLNVAFRKKLFSGLFGGEGFILEKISGQGIAFLEVDGDVIEKDLQPGEVIKVDTGNVVAFQEGMAYDIETVKGFKNVFFGGEGLFLTRITGPGKVILQTQNIKEFALELAQYLPTKTTVSNS